MAKDPAGQQAQARPIEPDPKREHPQQYPEHGGLVRIDGCRVLLVEDNEINQQIANELLTQQGATVVIAGNGREALERLEASGRSAFDVILMDLQMPEMDGIEATTRIRADARYDGLPVIAMTAHAMAEERERTAAVGMVDHITKPIDPAEMFATLARWVRVSPAKPSTPESAAGAPATDGIDRAAGLRRVGGNEALYDKLLRQFLEREVDSGSRLKARHSRPDRSPLNSQHWPHSFGVAGQSAESGSEASMEAARGAATELVRLLAESDGSAPDYLDSHASALRTLFDAKGWTAFTKAVNGFDFETALEVLRQAMAARGVELDH